MSVSRNHIFEKLPIQPADSSSNNYRPKDWPPQITIIYSSTEESTVLPITSSEIGWFDRTIPARYIAEVRTNQKASSRKILPFPIYTSGPRISSKNDQGPKIGFDRSYRSSIFQKCILVIRVCPKNEKIDSLPIDSIKPQDGILNSSTLQEILQSPPMLRFTKHVYRIPGHLRSSFQKRDDGLLLCEGHSDTLLEDTIRSAFDHIDSSPRKLLETTGKKEEVDPTRSAMIHKPIILPMVSTNKTLIREAEHRTKRENGPDKRKNRGATPYESGENGNVIPIQRRTRRRKSDLVRSCPPPEEQESQYREY
jgi:hypothetical protein